MTNGTAAGTALVEAPESPPAPTGRERLSPRLVVVYAAVAITLMAVVREITGANDLTSSGTFSAALRLAVPIGLAGLGSIYASRAGVVNIGLEGMMILGTWFGAWAGWQWGPWWGILAGVIGGALGGLLHAVATVTFGVDHVVSGVAINILAAGAARFLSVIAFTGSGGGATQSPQIEGRIGFFHVPFLSGGKLLGWRSPNFFGWLERRRWFLLSDIAGLGRGLTANLSWITVIAILLVPLSIFVLWRTSFGLRLRSVGEYPQAAESLGVPVYSLKYAGVIISGALAGLGGAFLAVVSAGLYREGQTSGRGFIGLATMIFGNWRPGGVAAGAGLFGFTDAMQLRDEKAVHAVLLFVAFACGLLAVRALTRGRVARAVVVGVTGVVVLLWFVTTDEVPRQIVGVFPYITTLLVLPLAAQRLRPPATEGLPFRKGQAV